MTSELAKRLGVEQQFTEGRTQEGWMRHLHELSRKAIPDLPDFDTFRKQGMYKQRDPEGHHVAYKAFRDDPQANPLTTPSGKIEIYSEELAKLPQRGNCRKGTLSIRCRFIRELRKLQRSADGEIPASVDRFPLQSACSLHLRQR